MSSTYTLIDGRAISRQIQQEVQDEIADLKEQHGIAPGLAVVLVGDDPASKTYVSSKSKTSAKLGMYSVQETLPATISEAELLAIVDRLNHDSAIHGILVQLPLPSQINPDRVIGRIDPRKDVDGLHPYNAGLLTIGRPHFVACTPLGICELLVRSGVQIRGRHVVILGRSNLVGRPLSILLSSKHRFGDATVTVCHSRSENLAGLCRQGDILIVAIGKRKFVTAEMVKPGAVVIDVGIHPALEPNGKMSGDVDFESVAPLTSMITPVPGGVGPMTIAMLMRNTLDAALRSISESAHAG
jgi:methylenetetrahydrofolate dehydrogenase (NADP+)/methenyltetrahydrofolate cyclohydrolase